MIHSIPIHRHWKLQKNSSTKKGYVTTRSGEILMDLDHVAAIDEHDAYWIIHSEQKEPIYLRKEHGKLQALFMAMHGFWNVAPQSKKRWPSWFSNKINIAHPATSIPPSIANNHASTDAIIQQLSNRAKSQPAINHSALYTNAYILVFALSTILGSLGWYYLMPITQMLFQYESSSMPYESLDTIAKGICYLNLSYSILRLSRMLRNT